MTTAAATTAAPITPTTPAPAIAAPTADTAPATVPAAPAAAPAPAAPAPAPPAAPPAAGAEAPAPALPAGAAAPADSACAYTCPAMSWVEMTADIRARVVATDRLVVNFKVFPLSCNGKVTSTICALKKLSTHLLARSRPYYRMLPVIHVSDNSHFFSNPPLLCHICLAISGNAHSRSLKYFQAIP